MDLITVVIAIIAASALLLPRVIRPFRKKEAPQSACGSGACGGCPVPGKSSGGVSCGEETR